MQQRRPRLGDIVDDYCPRERRITNHAVVAMIEDEVKRTRCTTCDAEHEFKQARVPAQRRKKDSASGGPADAVAAGPRKRPAPDAPDAVPADAAPADTVSSDALELPDTPAATVSEPVSMAPERADVEEVPLHASPEAAAAPEPFSEPEAAEEPPPIEEDDGPVHRRLIRATLPRPEGQPPERKMPEFTMHQREANGNRTGRHGRGPRPGQMRTQQGNGGQPPRFGGQRPGPRPGPGQGAGQGHPRRRKRRR